MVRNSQFRGRYEQMLANSATVAICANAQNLIVSWNAAAEKLFGHTAEHAIGQSLSIIIPADNRAAHEAGMARAVKSGKTPLDGQTVEVFVLHADGHEIPVDLSLSAWFENGRPMFGALMRDISDRHAAQQRLEFLANCDTLTALPNRNSMRLRMAAEIAKAPCSLLLLDLDGFKHVNDSLGHSVGDQLLAAVAGRFKEALDGGGFVARLGGDEFAVLLTNCECPLRVDETTSRIFEVLHHPFELAGQSVFVGTSIGIAMSPKSEQDVEYLLSCADLALYSAKNDGGGKRVFFTPAMKRDLEHGQRLGSELRQALYNHEFEVWYQPQFSMIDYQLSGVEALLRWRHPIHGVCVPKVFMGALEESVISEEVGDWVLDQACAAAAAFSHDGFGMLRVAVNLFPAQLRSGRLFAVVSDAIVRHNISASQLEIEITENTVLHDDNQSLKELKKLRSLGVGIAFDDFGTGFASLSLLRKYPLTRLKIDRSFVSKVDKEVCDESIVKAIIAMANGLGLAVIAEGVETAGQEKALLRLGCDEVQGYRYGRAIPAGRFIENGYQLARTPAKQVRRSSRTNCPINIPF